LPVTTGFPHLLAPGRIGAMTVRNRVVMSPMETMYGTPDGLPSQRTRDYFAARAKGSIARGVEILDSAIKQQSGFTASSTDNGRGREGIVKGIADDELAHAAAIDGSGRRGIGGNSLGRTRRVCNLETGDAI
jgi:2,4-dienoyl-CoA reductase (NADPH2)